MKIKQTILASILLLGMAACELIGDLEKMNPPFRMTDENVVSDAGSAESLLNGVYGSWRSEALGTMRLYVGVLTGTGALGNYYGMDEFVTNEIRNDNYAIGDYYPKLYLIVNSATSFLYNLEQNKQVKGLSDERRAEMNGEARYLRAQAYLMLLRHFGEFFDTSSKYGIVLYGDNPIRNNVPIARSSVAETYKAILADLDYAVDNAPAKQSKHYRVGSLTAKALKSRVLLYMKEFRKSADLAKEVIAQAQEKGYELEENFKTMFKEGFDSSEMLFALFSSSPSEIYSDKCWEIFSTGGTINKIANSLIKGKTDSRFKQIFIDKHNKEYIRNNKYPAEEADVKQNSHYYIRLSEMYYIIAESETRLGQSARAREALKNIICLPRAGYSEDYVNNIPESEMLKAILEHKWMEFATENSEEWSDLVRYRVWDNFNISPAYVVSDNRLVFPIPKKALLANNLLIQNVGYPE